jgi:hypothetical protein
LPALAEQVYMVMSGKYASPENAVPAPPAAPGAPSSPDAQAPAPTGSGGGGGKPGTQPAKPARAQKPPSSIGKRAPAIAASAHELTRV